MQHLIYHDVSYLLEKHLPHFDLRVMHYVTLCYVASYHIMSLYASLSDVRDTFIYHMLEMHLHHLNIEYKLESRDMIET